MGGNLMIQFDLSIWNGHGKDVKDMNAIEVICYGIGMYIAFIIFLAIILSPLIIWSLIK